MLYENLQKNDEKTMKRSLILTRTYSPVKKIFTDYKGGYEDTIENIIEYSKMNEVIRLIVLLDNHFLLRSFCYLNKVKIRFCTIVFTRLNTTKLSISSFLPYLNNKTTSVAARRYNPYPTLLPHFFFPVMLFMPATFFYCRNG